MRWPKKTTTISNAHLHVDPSESGLVGGWNMKPQGDRLIDLSPNGNDGTISGARYEKTLMGDALVFDGVDDVIDCGNDSSLDITTGSMTISCWFKTGMAAANYRYIIAKEGAFFGTGYRLVYTSAEKINFQIESGGTQIVASSNIAQNDDIWHHVVGVLDRSTEEVFLYIDGVLQAIQGDSTGVGSLTNVGDLGIGASIIGAVARWFDSKILGPQIFNEAKDQEWVTAEYLKGRNALWKTDWGAYESVAAVTAGPIENTPFQVNSGSFKISMDTIDGEPSGHQLLVDGDMEAGGVGDWTVINSALLTKEAGTRTGGSGSQVLKVATNGHIYPAAAETILEIGKTYRFKGWVKSDGAATPKVYNGGYIWTGGTSGEWERYDFEFKAVATQVRFYAITGGSGYVEWDDVTVELIPPNVKVIECIGAGICYVPISYFQQTPTESAYGEWEFWVNKGADANELRFYMAASFIGAMNDASQDAYLIRFQNDESVMLNLRSGGAGTTLFDTVASYKSINTWYKIKVTRTPAGVFTVYIDDVLVDPSGGSGTNPVTNATVTTGVYIMMDLDAGDKVAYADVKGKHSIIKKLTV